MDPDVNASLECHPRAKEEKVPRSNQVIAIDRANELGCLGVPPSEGVCVALIRRGKGRGTTGVVGQFPSNDAWFIGVARNYKPYILVKCFPDVLVREKFIMRLLCTKLLNIGIHTAYAVPNYQQIHIID